jgi:hypothetical protein
MAGMSAGARFIAEKLSDGVGVDIRVAEAAVQECSTTIHAFMGADGPLKLIFFYQIPEIVTDSGEYIATGTKPKLFLTSGEKERCRGKVYYFARIGPSAKAIDPKNLDTEVCYGEISAGVLDSFYNVLKGIFTPAISAQDWGKANVLFCVYAFYSLPADKFALSRQMRKLNSKVHWKSSTLYYRMLPLNLNICGRLSCRGCSLFCRGCSL